LLILLSTNLFCGIVSEAYNRGITEKNIERLRIDETMLIGNRNVIVLDTNAKEVSITSHNIPLIA
jgi:hypothetical protein